MDRSPINKELADFLKSRRRRLSPQAAGLPAQSSKRRTPGLRREEVAALSGVSLAWYTYLEQGRSIRVSEQVLDSIARTLRLDDDERSYLHVLAGRLLELDTAPVPAPAESVSASLQYMLDHMQACPAYVTGFRLNVLAWNRLACEVFGNFEAMDELHRNIVWRTFADAGYRRLFADWEPMARRLLAQFRIYCAKHIGDPWYNELVARLNEASPEFRTWWRDHEVFGIPTGKKQILHPSRGLLVFDYHSLLLADHPDCVLTVLTPDAATDTEAKLLGPAAESPFPVKGGSHD